MWPRCSLVTSRSRRTRARPSWNARRLNGSAGCPRSRIRLSHAHRPITFRRPALQHARPIARHPRPAVRRPHSAPGIHCRPLVGCVGEGEARGPDTGARGRSKPCRDQFDLAELQNQAAHQERLLADKDLELEQARAELLSLRGTVRSLQRYGVSLVRNGYSPAHTACRTALGSLYDDTKLTANERTRFLEAELFSAQERLQEQASQMKKVPPLTPSLHCHERGC